MKNLIRNTFLIQHQKQHLEDPAPVLLIISDALSTQSITAQGPQLHPQGLPQYGYQENIQLEKIKALPII